MSPTSEINKLNKYKNSDNFEPAPYMKEFYGTTSQLKTFTTVLSRNNSTEINIILDMT